jgi:hypothetical protein
VIAARLLKTDVHDLVIRSIGIPEPCVITVHAPWMAYPPGHGASAFREDGQWRIQVSTRSMLPSSWMIHRNQTVAFELGEGIQNGPLAHLRAHNNVVWVGFTRPPHGSRWVVDVVTMLALGTGPYMLDPDEPDPF